MQLEKTKALLRNSKLSNIFYRSQRVNPNSVKARFQIRYNSCLPEEVLNRLDSSATPVLDDWVEKNVSFYNYDQSFVNSIYTEYKVYKGSPEVKVFKDVIYIPQYTGLYTSQGSRIDCSCQYRRFNEKIYINAPEKVKPPKQLKKISQKLIYGGAPFGKHYGHFLTDSLARLWYAIKEPSYPILCHESYRINFLQKTFVDRFFKSINLDKNRFMSFSSPVLLEEVVIPSPSIINRIEGFEVHKLLPENVAKNLLPEKLEVTDRPLYISRSKLSSSHRLTINEDKLEKKLYESGFAICCPEKLSLRQQIYLINKHNVVIGNIGAAFHSILFNVSNTKNIIYLTGDFLPSTYLIIDAIKSIKSTYIKVCDQDLNCSQKATKQNQILNLDFSIDRLQNLGLL